MPRLLTGFCGNVFFSSFRIYRRYLGLLKITFVLRLRNGIGSLLLLGSILGRTYSVCLSNLPHLPPSTPLSFYIYLHPLTLPPFHNLRTLTPQNPSIIHPPLHNLHPKTHPARKVRLHNNLPPRLPQHLRQLPPLSSTLHLHLTTHVQHTRNLDPLAAPSDPMVCDRDSRSSHMLLHPGLPRLPPAQEVTRRFHAHVP